MEKIIAKNKSEFGAKKRELLEAGYVYDFEHAGFSVFTKNDGFKHIRVMVVKGW